MVSQMDPLSGFLYRDIAGWIAGATCAKTIFPFLIATPPRVPANKATLHVILRNSHGS
ncbi:MAG: hypothetical protein WCJ71_04485 [Candidatus Omnitrophota bacterium]